MSVPLKRRLMEGEGAESGSSEHDCRRVTDTTSAVTDTVKS
jgi:hypothetical protein